MNCSKCGGAAHCKDGVVQGRQRYRCKACGYRYTVVRKSDVKPDRTRRLALEMHLEGVGLRAIGRTLRISYGTVHRWVRGWGAGLRLPRRSAPASVVELDEMQRYIDGKMSAAGHGLLLIDMENGSSMLSVKPMEEVGDSTILN